MGATLPITHNYLSAKSHLCTHLLIASQRKNVNKAVRDLPKQRQRKETEEGSEGFLLSRRGQTNGKLTPRGLRLSLDVAMNYIIWLTEPSQSFPQKPNKEGCKLNCLEEGSDPPFT